MKEQFISEIILSKNSVSDSNLLIGLAYSAKITFTDDFFVNKICAYILLRLNKLISHSAMWNVLRLLQQYHD